LKYHGGWSLVESYSLPIRLRHWFMDRLAKQLKREAEENEKAANAK
tara:strand:+ start:2307 stop:2444 length:138 start_codon:yes stop_codon:yes gene_type:complete